MAEGSGSPVRSEDTQATSGRRPPVPGRRKLVGAVLMVAVGSFLPWVDTPVGEILGTDWAGLWTFYAAMVGLAGALVPIRVLAITQAALFSLVAVALPLVQVGQLLSLVGTSGWVPGPGLVLVVGGGVLAGFGVHQMLTNAWPAR